MFLLVLPSQHFTQCWPICKTLFTLHPQVEPVLQGCKQKSLDDSQLTMTRDLDIGEVIIRVRDEPLCLVAVSSKCLWLHQSDMRHLLTFFNFRALRYSRGKCTFFCREHRWCSNIGLSCNCTFKNLLELLLVLLQGQYALLKVVQSIANLLRWQ
uniref:Uncharacterized protein n=1 Tax=Chromera velia CCMP2878 TaxID=1169474 RepID=A0A0G4GYQ7_9ALVE|eukprot:Cvel_23957.t1-p1 / transcript=Cvel_23957.t1 / gene=Cvel_23957 / organism=Chromera_velia_CCMP2878 / gene_product=hypothetical protein / transcript_product=hypothetical protein / location=Cvel_scaffold2532:15473-15931(-) / protein_length=153 / sequence_SO=supercontig / SO=protein_coding / is_pseudo=false